MTDPQPVSQLMEDAARKDRWGALLLRAAQGESSAFTQFVSEAEKPLWRFVSLLVSDEGLIDDIVSEGLNKVWNNRDKFEPAKGSGRTWVYRVFKNLVRDVIQREDNRQKTLAHSFEALMARLRPDDGGTYEPEDAEETSPAERIVLRQRCRSVHEAMQTLSEKDRLALFLFHFEEMDYKEVAAVLKTTVKALGPRLTRARQRLKSAIEE